MIDDDIKEPTEDPVANPVCPPCPSCNGETKNIGKGRYLCLSEKEPLVINPDGDAKPVDLYGLFARVEAIEGEFATMKSTMKDAKKAISNSPLGKLLGGSDGASALKKILFGQ